MCLHYSAARPSPFPAPSPPSPCHLVGFLCRTSCNLRRIHHVFISRETNGERGAVLHIRLPPCNTCPHIAFACKHLLHTHAASGRLLFSFRHASSLSLLLMSAFVRLRDSKACKRLVDATRGSPLKEHKCMVMIQTLAMQSPAPTKPPDAVLILYIGSPGLWSQL